MSDKSNKYGYVGVDIPAQSFGANKGVFNPAEINELVANNQWTSFGQLELIETINASASSTVDLENLGSYNVHFITFNYEATSDTQTQLRFSNNGGTSYIASGYQYAMQFGATGGATSEARSTSDTYIRIAGLTTANNRIQGYVYCYNLLDSSKYSFITTHNFWYLNLASYNDTYQFGSGVLPTAETHNGIRFLGSGTITGDFSIYGIRYS